MIEQDIIDIKSLIQNMSSQMNYLPSILSELQSIKNYLSGMQANSQTTENNTLRLVTAIENLESVIFTKKMATEEPKKEEVVNS